MGSRLRDKFLANLRYSLGGVHGELVFTQVQVCEKALDNTIASNSQPSSPFEHYFHQLIEPEHHGAGRNGFGGD